MAYTIVKSNGQVLTTIADGTINTSSTSLALPGRNYAGYGQYLDTNFVHAIENFANASPPANPLAGQLWFNTNSNTMYVCPIDGASSSNWLALTSTASGGTINLYYNLRYASIRSLFLHCSPTVSSLSASKSRKGSSFLFGMVDAKDFVLSFVRLSLASSIAAFFAPNCSLVRIYVLE